MVRAEPAHNRRSSSLEGRGQEEAHPAGVRSNIRSQIRDVRISPQQPLKIAPSLSSLPLTATRANPAMTGMDALIVEKMGQASDLLAGGRLVGLEVGTGQSHDGEPLFGGQVEHPQVVHADAEQPTRTRARRTGGEVDGAT